MSRDVLNRLENICSKIGKITRQWLKQGTVLATVEGVEIRYGVFNRVLQQDGCAIIQRVGAGSRWFDPGYFNGESAKEWTRDTKWVDRCAEIMPEAWKCGFGGRTGSSDLPVPFDYGG